MLTNEVNRLRRRQLLQLRTKAAHDELQQQDEDYQTGDPEKPDGSLVAESVMKSEAEVGEVESGKNRQDSSIEVGLMATVEREHGGSTSGHVISDETAEQAAILVFVFIFLDIVYVVPRLSFVFYLAVQRHFIIASLDIFSKQQIN